MKNIINFIGFQSGWLICVFAAANAMPWAGPIAILCWVLIHLSINRQDYKLESLLIIVAALLGYCFDSALVLLGYISFPNYALLGYPSTLWMVALWINLATTLRHSLDWLNDRYLFISLFGGVGGALAYYAGNRLGAIILSDVIVSSVVVFFAWSIVLPLLYALINKLDKQFNSTTKQTITNTMKGRAHV